MEAALTLPRRIAGSESGVTAIEYGLVAALIGVVIIAAVAAVGVSLGNTFEAVAKATSDRPNGPNTSNRPRQPGEIVRRPTFPSKPPQKLSEDVTKKFPGEEDSSSDGTSSGSTDRFPLASNETSTTGGSSGTNSGNAPSGGGTADSGTTDGGSASTGSGGTDTAGGTSTGSGGTSTAGGESSDSASGPTTISARDLLAAAQGQPLTVQPAAGGTNGDAASLFPDEPGAGENSAGAAGTGGGLSFALASFEVADGQGSASAKGASSGGFGGEDNQAPSNLKSEAVSGDGGVELKGGRYSTTETPSDRVGLMNLAILLFGFIVIVLLIWHAFQRVIKESNNKRERSEWEKDKSKRNVRNLKVFSKNHGMAT
ncbi:MAG: Flp family type IVb pilin [Proteobacteria bacterium]|nr:Flp family type IVb pilin [Pseudomonadota bacterium]